MAVDVLFFGAHPDDVEWGVGGITLLLHDSGVSFALVDMTRGELGSRGTPEERKAEAIAAGAFLGSQARENLGLPDGGIVDTPQSRFLVASMIRRYRPKIVVAPLWERPASRSRGRRASSAELLLVLHVEESRRPKSAA